MQYSWIFPSWIISSYGNHPTGKSRTISQLSLRQASQPQLGRRLTPAAGRRPCVPGRSGWHLSSDAMGAKSPVGSIDRWLMDP